MARPQLPPLAGQAAQASAAGLGSDGAVVASEQPGILVQPASPLEASEPLSGVKVGAAVAPTQAPSSPEGSQGAGEGRGREEGAPRLQLGGEPPNVVPDSESEGEGDGGGSPAADLINPKPYINPKGLYADRLAGQQPLIAVEQEQHAKVRILDSAATIMVLMQWITGLQCL